MLSGIAVPTGVLIGNVCAYLIKPEGFAVADLFLMAFGASMFGILTVLFSVRKPAKMAGSVSPLTNKVLYITKHCKANSVLAVFDFFIHFNYNPVYQSV